MIDTLLLAAALLSFVFGWNNSSLLIGNMRGSGVFGLRGALAVSALGLLMGVVVEGSKMLKSLDGSLASSASDLGLSVTIVISLLVTLSLTLLKLPAPFSSTMVGAFLGVAYESGLAVNYAQVFLVIAFWFLAPAIACLIAFVLHRAASLFVSGLGLVAADSFNRAGVVLGSLAVAFTLGANNIGLITGTALGGSQPEDSFQLGLALTVVALAGVVALGSGNVSGTIGDRMLSLSPQGVLVVFMGSAITVWIGTQLQVPMSISQCVLGGMIGSAYAQRTAVLNPRLLVESLSTWAVVPVAGFILSFLAMSLLA